MRRLVFLSMVGAAVGVPYMATRGKSLVDGASGGVSSYFAKESTDSSEFDQGSAEPFSISIEQNEPSYDASVATPPPASRTGQPQSAGGSEEIRFHPIDEVLRMDVTPSWVYARWSQKFTALSDLELFGVRVPLVSGTRVDDVAGSLSYYFSAEGRAEKIVFRGSTGDPRRLIQLVATRFQLTGQEAKIPGELLYEYRRYGKPMSRLRIRPAGLVSVGTPHTNYEVELDLHNPAGRRYLDEPKPPPVVVEAPPPPPVEPDPEPKPSARDLPSNAILLPPRM